MALAILPVSGFVQVDSIINLSYDQLNENLYQNKSTIVDLFETAEMSAEQQAKLNAQLSTIEYLQGNYLESTEAQTKAIEFYEEVDDLSALANANYQLGWRIKDRDIGKAKQFVRKAMRQLEDFDTGDKRLAEIYDNYGVLLERGNEVDSALLFYNKSLAFKREIGDSVGVPYSLQKMAVANAKKGLFTLSQQQIEEAITSARKDSLALAETYAYAGDIDVLKTNYNEAIIDFERSLAISENKGYTYLVKYDLEQLANAHTQVGNSAQALKYYKRFNTVKDSMITADTQRALAQYEVAFDTSQKEREIELLNKENKIQNLRSRVLLVSLIAAALSFAIFGLLKNRRELRLKSELKQAELNQLHAVIEAEESEKERIARELHDGVGQLIAAAKMNVAALGNSVAKTDQDIHESALDLIDQSAQEVRMISHELIPINLQNKSLKEVLEGQVSRMNKAGKGVIELAIGDVAFTDKTTELHLLRISQELLKNGLKHSGSDRLQLSIKPMGRETVLTYQDWGKGLDIDQMDQSKGIGWKNIQERVKALDGTINLADQNEGTRINIVI